MKRFTLLYIIIFTMSQLTMSQYKLYVNFKDGTNVSYIASTVDNITIQQENSNEQPEEVHDYVDLGLPSGTLWATMNIGAESPEDMGDHFMWGELEVRTDFSDNEYKWSGRSRYEIKKYCTNEYYGQVDNKMVLDLEDDVAHVNWGGYWRMPTRKEYKELLDNNNCTWTWVTKNGVEGYEVTSNKNGNSIFLPTSGYKFSSQWAYQGYYGNYWSSTLDIRDNTGAYYFYFIPSVHAENNNYRTYGHVVRPVIPAINKYTISFNANGGEGTMSSLEVKYAEYTKLPACSFVREGYEFIGWKMISNENGLLFEDETSLSTCEDLVLYAQWLPKNVTYSTHEGYKYVDLGLSVKWATMNIGAESPEDYGDYIAWGALSEDDPYPWGLDEECIRYCADSEEYTDDLIRLYHSDDAASYNWGGNWRMPTSEEFMELIRECVWTYATRNGIRGYIVSSKVNDNYIFLPAGGTYKGSDAGLVGCYWTNTASAREGNNNSANAFSFEIGSIEIDYYFHEYEYYRDTPMSIRPVLQYY